MFLASSPLRHRAFQHITVCHLNGEPPLQASSAASVKNTTLQGHGSNDSSCSASTSVLPITNFPLTASDSGTRGQNLPKFQSAISELITGIMLLINNMS